MKKSKTKTLKQFILGYPHDKDVDPKNLRRYDSKEAADFDTEEWCEVWASSLKEAKGLYEQSFAEWKVKHEADMLKLRQGNHKSPFGIGA